MKCTAAAVLGLAVLLIQRTACPAPEDALSIADFEAEDCVSKIEVNEG